MTKALAGVHATRHGRRLQGSRAAAARDGTQAAYASIPASE
ncbi:MAG: hypothetical protein QM650_13335 [Microlunatus sp.]